MFKLFVGVVFVVLFVVFVVVYVEDVGLIVIKFFYVVFDDMFKGKGVLLFKKFVEECLLGKVKVEVYFNLMLFGDVDEIEVLCVNKVQMLVILLFKFEFYIK